MANKQQHSKIDKPGGTGGFNALPWIAGVVLLLGLTVIAGLYWRQNMTVKELSFEGYHFVDPRELQDKVQIPAGVKPDSLDLAGIMKEVEKIPYVKYADVKLEPGGKVSIHITERQPIALLADGDKKIYIDEEGIRLELILGKSVDVPILYGFRAEPMSDTLDSEAFRAVRDFLVEMKKRRVSNATISEVAWSHEQGVVALTNENGVKLVFGKHDYKSRLRNWEAFYGEIIKTKGINSMRSVDLRFQGQIVTRES